MALVVSNTYGSYQINRPGLIQVGTGAVNNQLYLPLVLKNAPTR